MTTQNLYKENFQLHLQARPAFEKPVLLKEPAHDHLTIAQIAQLHNEHAICQYLGHLPGVRQVYAIEGLDSHPVLILEYIEGVSLAQLIEGQSLDLSQKLQLGVRIATILSRIHDMGVIHRDISSSNILISAGEPPSGTGEVTIIDFGLAAKPGEVGVSGTIEIASLAGSLAYISPELTGRTNRLVDDRTDLYSLGVILYELLTGRLPFEADDPMEMIHSHLAHDPPALFEFETSIPYVLSDIILKLLAKDADGRYQSASGLCTDLTYCLQQLQDTGLIESFEIGADDFIGRLAFSRKLYGRQTEISQLIATYDRVAQRNPELLFVAGYSGVGKTSLVHEIRGDVLSKGGIFVEGKFDQLQRTLPYSAWAQAITQLVHNWLAESETNLAGWRAAILDAVGDHGQILIDIIPALERIIGLQPEVPQLDGIENQNRLNYTFNRFISNLATPEHPLVVFLDDLQWIDLASLNLIEVLTAAHSTDCILIIGAYRDNEVGPDHPLMISQDKMRAASNQVRIITLGDLAPVDVDHLLADTLQLPVAECRPVSRVLADKTAGNPFYFRQLLYALESDGLLRFDRERRRWVWEEDLHQSLQARGNVVDLMISKIQTLPVVTQRNLSMAACIGSRFETSTLGTIIGQPQTDILTDLSPALKDGLIVQSNGYYTFSHDRVQEAWYSLIPRSELPKIHLKIGRLLLAHTAAEDLDEEIFGIVRHLNAGRALIDRAAETTELAALNLKAGQKAKIAAAYSDAKKYIEIGLDLLGPDSWKEQYELTLSLHNENGELASLTGQYDQIAPIANLVQANAKNVLDQVRIYMTQIEAETTQYNFPKALEIGLEVLRELDVEIPAQPTPEDYQRLNDQLVDLLTSKPLESLTELPEMTDKRALVASFILASEISTSYIVNPQLSIIIQYHGAIFTLEFGLNAWSPFFLGVIALLNIGTVNYETPADVAFDQILLANQLIKNVHEMLKSPITARGRTKALQTLAVATPWIEPIEKGLELAQTTFRSGFESGDLVYAAYCASHYAMQGFAAGMNLDVYQSQLSDYTNRLLRVGQVTTPLYVSIFLQATQSFKEASPEPYQLNGTYFSEDEWLPDAHAANDFFGLHIFSVYRFALVYHFDFDDKLDECAGEVEQYLHAGATVFSTPIAYWYLALAKLRSVGGSSSKEHHGTIDLVNKSLHWLEIWSATTPSTFRHKVDLIAAEKARVTGDLGGALSHYEQAISGARENGFTHEEALANELYARFWLERDNERFAGQFMREAHSLYRKWGALAKAEHLTKRYPNLMVGRSIAIDDSRTGAVFDQLSGNLDLMTILKTSQTIAGEIELDRLLGLLMTRAIENSGAQRGFLLLPENGQWRMVAQSEMDKMDVQVEQPRPVAGSDLLSQRIVHYVARTQQTVLLADASQEGEFVEDPYVQGNEVKSLLSTPLVNQGKTSAILYLENNLSPGTFTPERVELLRLLSSQMAISIDNARTHDHLEQLLEDRSRDLDSAEAQIRSIFENSPLGIFLSSFEGEILSVNKTLLNMLRVSEEELLQRNAIDFYAEPDDRAASLTETQESGANQDFGVQLIRNDGSSFFASINMSRLDLGGNEVLLTMVEDVTDELMAEQEIATLEERERLARELHDVVSQTLFTAGMIAEATPGLWDKDRAIGQQNIDMLSVLIRGASAEMRSLLLELRPDTLRDQTLGNLLETQVVAVRARTQAEVFLNVECDPQLPEDVTITLHRIAQESLNNVACGVNSPAEPIEPPLGPSNTGFEGRFAHSEKNIKVVLKAGSTSSANEGLTFLSSHHSQDARTISSGNHADYPMHSPTPVQTDAITGLFGFL